MSVFEVQQVRYGGVKTPHREVVGMGIKFRRVSGVCDGYNGYAKMTKTIESIEVMDAEKRRVPSKHYVYVIHVKWSDGSSMVVYRRYSRFFDLQTQLLDKFPIDAGITDPNRRIIPFLPGKIFFGRSHIRDVAMKRLGEIDTYCKSLLKLPPYISQSDEVLAFFEVEPEDLDPPKEDPKHKSDKAEKKAEKISGPKHLEQCLVIADYEAQEKGEISLQAGVTVEVVEKSESEEQQGWVPSTYLQPADGDQSAAPYAEDGEEEKYICIERYEAVNDDELTLEKGVVVEALQKNLDGWWLVRYQGQEGIAPATYLKKSTDPHAINLVEKSRKSGVQIISNLAAISNIMPASSSPRNSGIFTDSARNSTANIGSAGNSTAGVGGARNSALSDMLSQAAESRQEEEEDEWEDEDEERDLVHEPGPQGDSYAKIMMKQKSLERGGSLKPPPRQNSVKRLNVPPPPPPASKKPTTTYVTVEEFEDTVGDGISFGVGETVTVLEKATSGWWFVRRGEEEGWVPESFLEPAGSSEQTNGDHSARLSSSPPKPPEKQVSKPPTLPAKPVEPAKSEKTGVEETSKGNQLSGVASALKSKFENKPPSLPTKPSDRPAAPPPPPNKPKPSSDETDAVTSTGRVSGIASALKSKFEAKQQADDKPTPPASKPAPPASKPAPPASKPAPPSKPAVGNKPAPPQKPGGTPPKPPATQKPSLPLKKPGADSAGNERVSLLANKPKPTLPGGPPKLPSGPPKMPAGPSNSGQPKLPSGPPKLPSGPPKLPSNPPGHKESYDSHKPSDLPTSTNRVSNMAAAFLGAGQDKPGGKPSLPGKKPQPPAQKTLPGVSEKPKVGNIVSELSGKLNFGGGGMGGGAKHKSPEPSPVSKSGPGMWSGMQGTGDAANSQPIPVFPGMPGVGKPSGMAANKPAPVPPVNASSSAKYQAIAYYDASSQGEVSLTYGDVVEVIDKQDEWWLVNSNGMEGWVPANCLELLSNGGAPTPPPPPAPPQKPVTHRKAVYRTVCAFVAQSDQELGFEEGQEVNVLEETDTGWWKVEIDGQTGWAPADHIEVENS